jgi:Flp pilus assembly protein TadG
MSRLRERLDRVRSRMRARSHAGSAGIEFAFVAPVFFLLIFASIESSILYFSQATLQYAVNDAARFVRTGQAQATTQAAFRTRICNDIAPLIPCDANLQVDMESFPNFTSASYPPPLDANGNLNATLTNYQQGTACSVVLVRVFYKWSVMTPLLTPFLSNMTGDFHLISAAAAFRNEPYSTGMSGC